MLSTHWRLLLWAFFPSHVETTTVVCWCMCVCVFVGVCDYLYFWLYGCFILYFGLCFCQSLQPLYTRQTHKHTRTYTRPLTLRIRLYPPKNTGKNSTEMLRIPHFFWISYTFWLHSHIQWCWWLDPHYVCVYIVYGIAIFYHTRFAIAFALFQLFIFFHHHGILCVFSIWSYAHMHQPNSTLIQTHTRSEFFVCTSLFYQQNFGFSIHSISLIAFCFQIENIQCGENKHSLFPEISYVIYGKSQFQLLTYLYSLDIFHWIRHLTGV